VEHFAMKSSVVRSRSLCEKLRPVFRGSCCIRVPEEIIHDPDPAIYDQQLIFLTGTIPTFNSPDIDTVDVWPLRPIDNLRVSCRNLSATSSANQTRIDLSWSPWGIGMQRQAIGSSYVDLARAGFPGSEAKILQPLPPVVKAAGRYGIFVKLFHPYDTNVSNNQGEQTADGFQTSAGRSKTFVVPVRNPTAAAQTVVLSVGPPSVAPWVNVVPAVLTLAAGAQQNVMVSINVPSAIPPSPAGTLISAAVDVLATIGGAYLGGVSILILFDA
jgi:hypothetical protein